MQRVPQHIPLKSLFLIISLFALSYSAQATTAILPADDEMIIAARAIVRGKVVSVESAFDGQNLIFTYITLKVKEVLKGQITERRIVIKEPGGEVGSRGSLVFGTPTFKRGDRVLLYLDTWRDGSLRIHQMFLGSFSIFEDARTGEAMVSRNVPDIGVSVLGQSTSGPITNSSELSKYTTMVRSRLAANRSRAREFEKKVYGRIPILARPTEYKQSADEGDISPQYHILNPPIRWFEPDSGQNVIFKTNTDGAPNPQTPGDVVAAMNAWSTVPGCSLRVADGGSTEGCGLFVFDGENTISFNNCDNYFSGTGNCSSGILAVASVPTYDRFQTTVVNGVTFYKALESNISFNPYASCYFNDHAQVREIATHEMGHSLGLHHSWQPSFGGTPTAAEQAATMYYVAHFDGRGASLMADDVNGIKFIYPSSGGAPLSVVTTALPGGTVGTAYSQPLSASGGTLPYSWTVISGALPPNLTLSTSGTISGTPTTAGTYNFTVRVTDSVQATATQALGIVISTGGGGGALSVVTTSLPGGTVGTSYSQSLSASGGTLPYSWTVISGALPPNLTLSTSGTISGTPTTAGTYNFTVQVTDSVQATATQALGIVISTGGGGPLNSQFVSQSVPTTLDPGQQFTANIKFLNTGTTTWTGTQFYYASQNPALNATWGGNGVWLFGFSAAPNQVMDVTFTATAPETPGIYNFQWQMYQDQGAGFFGQMSTNVPISVGQPTLAEFVSAMGTGFEDGVHLRWQTGMELDNLGFNIYREEFGKQTLVNKQLIAGSALTAGSGVAIRSGFTYEWWDPKPASAATQYVIEAVDLNGNAKRFGPYLVQAATSGQKAAVATAKLLSALGNTEVPSSQFEPFARSADLHLALSSTPQIQPSKKALKLFVKRAGFYRLTQEELVRAGLDPSVDPRTLTLIVAGHEQAIQVKGEKDGRLDPGDTVEFYGTGVDSPYTDARVYWLVAGMSQGKRMKIQESPAKPTAVGSFPYTVERKERTVYFAALRNGELENFFGAVVSAQPLQQSLTVNHVDAASGESAILELALQGVTQQAHEVIVEINGSQLGRMEFNAQTNQLSRFSVSTSLLRNGDNTVTLSTTGNAADVSLVDYVRLTYPHLYAAEGNQLRFNAQGGQPLTIVGFTGKAIRLFDLTDPDNPQELQGAIGQEDTGYQLSLLTPGSSARDLLAVAEETIQRPANVELDTPSNWRDPNQAAEFVILTSREMVSAAESLASYRQKQGLSTAVVNVIDVYDEFSFGEKTPLAIKAFVDYARRNWRIPPRYVLLMGDSSYDMKNYLGLGDFDLIPTKLVDNAFMETASDDWLADFNDDGIADIALGRLPVRSAEEANLLVKKIIGYENTEASKEALGVADSNDGFNFETVIDELRALLPAEVRAEEIKRGQMGDVAAKAALLEALNRGQKLVSYAGHGSMNVWRGNLLTNDDASELHNGQRLSLFLMMDCLNGYFVTPNADSLAEALLKAEGGGAVAVWASTSVTYPDSQRLIGQQLYRELFSNRKVRLGDAVLRAKAKSGDLDVRRSWILFADPTLQLR